MAQKRSIAIVGAGAAGCFAAAVLPRLVKDARITLYESAPKPMLKLARTGGGRCNITNTFASVKDLRDVYPRGTQMMKRALGCLSVEETCRWFEAEGIALTAQDDGCIFPVSQDAMQVVRTLQRLMDRGGVTLKCNSRIEDVTCLDADCILVTTGGGALKLLEPLQLPLEPCVPSLFTFKIADDGLRALMGTVVEDVILGLAGTRFRSSGTLLLTDWGVSGPATLRLSSYAAVHLAQSGYKATLLINWISATEADAAAIINAFEQQKSVVNSRPQGITDRLWRHLLSRAGIPENRRWAEVGARTRSRLVSVLTADSYPIEGRARFKEEFVTCGGVSSKAVNISTLECRTRPGLFFAGEVLDIDAVTGGFNLQAAWSTAMLAATSIADAQ